MERVNIKGINGIHYKNMLLLESVEDGNQYINNDLTTEMDNSTKDIIDKIKNRKIGHCNFNLAEVAEMTSNLTGQGSLYLIGNIADSIKSNILRLLNNGKKVAINNRGGYFDLDEKDIIEYITTYTESDIDIFRWNNGNHFYAKVGRFDVVIDGVVKWNTTEEAMRNAIIYLKQL